MKFSNRDWINKLFPIAISIFLFIYVSKTNAYILTTPNYHNDKTTDAYINKILNTNLCLNYNSNQAITLKQSINITIACNRNVRKLLLNRMSENYNLSIATYKFMPHAKLNLNTDYTKIDNNLTDTSIRTGNINPNLDLQTKSNYSVKTTNITPEFSILTPLGTNINLNWQNFTTDSSTINSFRNASTITIRQPLLKQSGIKLQTASIKNSYDNNNLQLMRLYDSLEDEINKTIFLFRNIIQNQNQLSIQEKVLEVSKKLLEQTKALIKSGRLATYEQTQVASQVASQEVNLADAKINLKRSYLQLANQLGINQKNLIIDYSHHINDVPKPLNKPVEELLKLTLTNNITYQSLLTQQKITERDYYIAYDQSRWSLDLIARYNIQGYANSYSKSIDQLLRSSDQNSYYGIQFDIPIDFNPDRNQALLENKIRLKQIQLDKKQLELEIYSDLQDKIYQNQILWDKLQLAKKSVQIKQDNFNMAQKKYESGRLSSFELVRIQDDVEAARVLENSSIIAYLNNYTTIDKILNKTLPAWGVNLSID